MKTWKEMLLPKFHTLEREQPNKVNAIKKSNVLLKYSILCLFWIALLLNKINISK